MRYVALFIYDDARLCIHFSLPGMSADKTGCSNNLYVLNWEQLKHS